MISKDELREYYRKLVASQAKAEATRASRTYVPLAEHPARNLAIWEAFQGGKSAPTLAKQFGLARSRVYQIIANIDRRKAWEQNLAIHRRDVNANTLLEDLDFSVRAKRCFRNDNMKTIADLLRLSATDLARIPNMGRKSIREIEDLLASEGLSLRT